MAYRFTNTDKWSDAWYSQLRPIQKLLFNYLCDNCDIAGFIEINIKRWASDISTDSRSIEGALKGLSRGLIYSNTNDCIFLRTYIRHQKNLPLTPEKNPAHRGIIARFEFYKYKFGFEDSTQFIEGALKGLNSPIDKGNGNVGGEGGSKISQEEMSIAFYTTEVEKAKGFSGDMAKAYINLARHICLKNTDGTYRMNFLLKVKNQISLNEFAKLYDKTKGNVELITSKIDSFQTNINYYKRFSDIYLSVNKWLIKDKK